MVKREPMEMYYRKLYMATIPPYARRTYNKFKKDIGVPMSDPVDWDAIILRFLMSGPMARRITAVTENTKDMLRQILMQAMEEGLSNEQTQRLMRKSYAMSRKRSLMISRTELGTAEMTGDYVGAERLSLEGYPIKKTWLATMDSRTRDSHANLNGVTIPINQSFDVNGFSMSRPLDPAGPASEIIQCRCDLTYSL